jgi:hypothetical protein
MFMTSCLLKILSVLTMSIMVAGCKLVVIVPSGGDVTSASGTRNCSGGSLCEHNITADNFNETFTAVAKPGYVFAKWSTGSSGFFCKDSINPNCVINNVGAAVNPVIESVIAGGQHFYIMPLFDFVGIDTDEDGIKDHVDTDDDNDGFLDVDDNCPLEGPSYDGLGCPIPQAITDTVLGGGWAQVDLFLNLSWAEIQAVCPNGPCANGGSLNGHDMTGWVWASPSRVAGLFNSYGLTPRVIPESFSFEPEDLSSHARFFASGWRETYPGPSVSGLTSGCPGMTSFCPLPPSEDLYYLRYFWENNNLVGSGGAFNAFTRRPEVGAWFHRAP